MIKRRSAVYSHRNDVAVCVGALAAARLPRQVAHSCQAALQSLRGAATSPSWHGAPPRCHTHCAPYAIAKIKNASSPFLSMPPAALRQGAQQPAAAVPDFPHSVVQTAGLPPSGTAGVLGLSGAAVRRGEPPRQEPGGESRRGFEV
eukprot:360329-Chlamydomonas_euryale.AAC.6